MIGFFPLLLAWACDQTRQVPGTFDGPSGIAILDAEYGSPFADPVALVANTRSGTIVALDLKRGMYVADDPGASFLRAQDIPTGSARILGDLVARTPGDGTVTLFVADALSERLLEVPYIVDIDDAGTPVEVTPALAAEPVFIDVDDSGDKAEILSLQLHSGAATTEDWVVEFDGAYWQVRGSSSGTQARPAQTLQPYQATSGAFDLLISGTATAGDRFEFSVDTGLVEHDLGGFIEAILLVRNPGWLVASVLDRQTGEGVVRAFDPASAAVIGDIELPEGAHPGRIISDLSGDLLFVADLARPVVYEVLLDDNAPSASAYRELAMPEPIADLAWQGDAGFEHLFVAPVGANSVDVYDLVADAWLDVNPYTEVLDGIDLRAPVTGLASLADPVLLLGQTATSARRRERVVAISTFEGALFLAEGSTGCLAQDEIGPFGVADPDNEFIDRGAVSNTLLWADEVTGDVIQVNRCAGIARNEQWTATFDEVDGSWVVEGSDAGLQENRAYEDVRYISDRGEISFLLLAGSQPSSEGDRFTFEVFAGSLKIAGDINGDGQISSGEYTLRAPGRPTAYRYFAGATGGGWDLVNRKVGVLWPMTGSDSVFRVNMQSGQIEQVWD